MINKRILILSNHFITLYSFRRELIKSLIDQNYDVYLSMPKNDKNCYFSDMGCTIIDTDVDRRGINPYRDTKLIHKYYSIMKDIKPNIVLSYTIKPNIYGSLVSNHLKLRHVSNITGTGGTFLSDSIVSKVVRTLYRKTLKKSYKVFFQNTDDMKYFIDNEMVKDNCELLPGSGVNLDFFTYTPIPTNQDDIRFIFVGRVMEIKGIEEYINAAYAIKKKYTNVIFEVAGFIEEEKYQSLIDNAVADGVITYLGYQDNICQCIKDTHCVVLPSHGGEGVPNVLLEASAMGRICIATDIGGSRDVVVQEKTGYLFEKRNCEQLISCMEAFINLDFDDKQDMGYAGRVHVEQNFDRQIVIGKYLHEVQYSND